MADEGDGIQQESKPQTLDYRRLEGAVRPRIGRALFALTLAGLSLCWPLTGTLFDRDLLQLLAPLGLVMACISLGISWGFLGRIKHQPGAPGEGWAAIAVLLSMVSFFINGVGTFLILFVARM